MNNVSAWMLVGALSLGCALATQASEMNGTTEKAVTALEEQWSQAQRENNIEMEIPLLADNFALIDVDGNVINRMQFIANERTTKYTSMSVEELHVTAFGDTAVARSLIRFKGTDQKGKPMDSHSRWTDVWMKMPSGKWQCVASHGSNVKM